MRDLLPARLRTPRRLDPRRNSWAKARVAEWNDKVPAAPYEVRYWRGVRPADDSGGEVGVVYTRAHLMSGITPVVFIRGAGAVALTHVEPTGG